MARVYLETSFVSACVTNRTDVPSLYRREASQDWWRTQRRMHEVFVSAEVVAELSRPSYPMSAQAREWVRDVPLLSLTEEVLGLAEVLVRERVMPGPIGGDATHVAVSCVHRVEYMLSWNVRHLANANKRRHLDKVCVRAGYLPPMIVTPDLLWEKE
jgi:hypothetical protein